jgi:alpha-tubulin suppressor-like RCC1 family protein
MIDRNLYTFGNNEHGQLGHGDKKNLVSPKIVEFFSKKNIKIRDAVCG